MSIEEPLATHWRRHFKQLFEISTSLKDLCYFNLISPSEISVPE